MNPLLVLNNLVSAESLKAATSPCSTTAHPEGIVAISTPTYISFLTLVVTIVIVVLAILSAIAEYRARRTFAEAQRFLGNAEEFYDKTVESCDEIKSKHNEITKEISLYLSSIKNSAGAFLPSGENLSNEVRNIVSVLDLQKCKECGDTIKTLVEKLSSAFLVNAVFGQQIQKLFVGTKDEVLGSIMYLSQKPSSYSFSLSLLEDRLKIEKKIYPRY